MLTVPSFTEGWGNGCATCNSGYPHYGVHDAIADAALGWVQEEEPRRARWIERWYIEFGGDFEESFEKYALAPSRGDNWLAYTDDPDSSFRDWPNHLFIVNTRPGYESRLGPQAVAWRFDRAVENLTLAKLGGPVLGVLFEHQAAYHMGVAAHYVGDMTQFGHTDDTKRDHSRPSYDPKGRTFHGYYESVEWTSSALGALDAKLQAGPEPLARVANVAAEVEALARHTNSDDGSTVRYKDSTGATVTVGADYAWMLDRYVAQYNAGTRYKGMRGYDAVLFDAAAEDARAGVHLLARLIAEADRRATLVDVPLE